MNGVGVRVVGVEMEEEEKEEKRVQIDRFEERVECKEKKENEE